MSTEVRIKRKLIPITFSRDLEGLLFNFPAQHTSLTDDLEAAATSGLKRLEALEDARDLKHRDQLQALIQQVNHYSKMDSQYFTSWHLSISEDLLDEIDLLLLAHGDDLKELGLNHVTQGGVVVLLAVAAVTDFTL